VLALILHVFVVVVVVVVVLLLLLVVVVVVLVEVAGLLARIGCGLRRRRGRDLKAKAAQLAAQTAGSDDDGAALPLGRDTIGTVGAGVKHTLAFGSARLHRQEHGVAGEGNRTGRRALSQPAFMGKDGRRERRWRRARVRARERGGEEGWRWRRRRWRERATRRHGHRGRERTRTPEAAEEAAAAEGDTEGWRRAFRRKPPRLPRPRNNPTRGTTLPSFMGRSLALFFAPLALSLAVQTITIEKPKEPATTAAATAAAATVAAAVAAAGGASGAC